MTDPLSFIFPYLSFRRSTTTSQEVLKLDATCNLKPMTLELGGKSHFIVYKDAYVDQDAELAHFTLFFNQARSLVSYMYLIFDQCLANHFLLQGQCCCPKSWAYVHEIIYDEFVEKEKS